jgi:transposase
MGKKKYSQEFKAEAVKLVLEQGLTRAQVTKDLDLPNGVVGRWIRDLNEASVNSSGLVQINCSSNTSPEVALLQKENRRLRMERDILKKAITFFKEGE